MVIEYIRYRIPPQMRGAFLGDYAKAAEHLRASPVCLGYELSCCEEDPACFILRIQWTSTQDHLQTFRDSPQFRAFLPPVSCYLANIEEVRHYALTDIRWSRGT